METGKNIFGTGTLLILLFAFFVSASFSQKPSSISKVENYSDSVAKAYLNSTSLDPIEGIWLTENGYKIAIEKNPENGTRNPKRFRAVILSINYRSDLWKAGFIRAYIECTATPGVYYIDYFLGNRDTLVTETCTGYYESGDYALRLKPVNSKNIEEVNFYKTYPKNEDALFADKDIYTPSYGSGLVFTENGCLITNYHVVCNAKTISITGINKDFKKKYTAKVIIADEMNDLALLKISDAGFKEITDIPFSFRFSNLVQGEDVYALGYPAAIEMPEKATLTDGKISSVSGINGNDSYYRTSVRLRPGNSGGPLFDAKGNIAGINTLRISATENVSYAVNAKYIRSLASLADDKPIFPFLNTIEDKPLLEKSKVISNYVCIVDCNGYFRLTDFDAGNVKVLGADNPSETLNDPQAYYTMAMLKINTNDYSSALDYLNKAISKGLKETMLFSLRGQMRIALKLELDEAVADFNYCLKNEKDTNSRKGYIYNRGKAYDMLGKYNDAKTDYTYCIKHKCDKSEESLYARALINEKLGNYPDAVSDWDTLLAKNKDIASLQKATVFYNKAECLLKLNKPEDALLLVNRALEIITTDVKMWVLRAKIYNKLLQYDDAVKDINKALTVDDEPEAYYVRSIAYKGLGQVALAEKDINKAALLGFNNK